MWTLGFILVLATICNGGPTTPKNIICGEIPDDMMKCLGNPALSKAGDHSQCGRAVTECDRYKCVYRDWGWISDSGAVDLSAARAHYAQLLAKHPEWSAAVDAINTTCLANALPVQGVHLNCAVYDISHCALAQFIKHAPASQWSSVPSCARAREFAENCPYCPSECFAPLIPVGSCNACFALPRSPTPERRQG